MPTDMRFAVAVCAISRTSRRRRQYELAGAGETGAFCIHIQTARFIQQRSARRIFSSAPHNTCFTDTPINCAVNGYYFGKVVIFWNLYLHEFAMPVIKLTAKNVQNVKY